MRSDARKFALPVVAAGLILGVFASSALAVHARPSSATPFRVPLVTAMKQCASATGDPAGMVHGGTLAFPSCAPASAGGGVFYGPASTNISFGSPGSPAPAPAQGGGFVLLCTTTGCGTTFAGGNGIPAAPCPSIYAATCTTLPAGGGDVEIESTILDVRCVAATTCSAPGSNGAQTTTDYTGRVRGSATIRITDHNNGAPGYTTTATVADLPFTVDGACAENPGTGSAGAPIGGTCSVHTTANTAVPGAGTPGKLGNVEIGLSAGANTGGIVIHDGGTNGSVTDTTDGPNLNWLRQGILIP